MDIKKIIGLSKTNIENFFLILMTALVFGGIAVHFGLRNEVLTKKNQSLRLDNHRLLIVKDMQWELIDGLCVKLRACEDTCICEEFWGE